MPAKNTTTSKGAMTDQVGVIPVAPKSVSSPNSTRDALLQAFK